MYVRLPSLPIRHGRTFSSVAKTPQPWTSPKEYDVVVVGGGITGTALLYNLARFTNLERIALIERRSDFAMVASAGTNNSQTIHCGDIETNYTFEKAQTVRKQADMLRNWATKLPWNERDNIIKRMPKMAIGVGEKEMKFISHRYDTFKSLFPDMHLLDFQEIAKVEPKLTEGRKEDLNAIYVDSEYTAVDYNTMSKALVQQALKQEGKTIDVFLDTEMKGTTILANGDKSVETSNGEIKCKFLTVSACGYSLLMAQRLGYGTQYSCLPVAGSFYFVPGSFLNGKVYTVQNPKLPFAAVHGDPDIVAKGKTRFGPTALALPVLERYSGMESFKDFCEVANPNKDVMAVLWNLLKDSDIRNYMIKNALFEVPKINARLFADDARKIIPSLKVEDLSYADGFGGVRPQLIDKDQRKLLLGEGKISTDAGIIFNITPSPGGTTCLGTAEVDMRTIASYLNCNIDEKLLRFEMHEGVHPTDPAVKPLLELEYQALESMYDQFDEDKDKNITLDEWMKIIYTPKIQGQFEKMKMDMGEMRAPGWAEALFKQLDEDKSGTLGMDEFISGLAKMRENMQIHDVWTQKKKLDK